MLSLRTLSHAETQGLVCQGQRFVKWNLRNELRSSCSIIGVAMSREYVCASQSDPTVLLVTAPRGRRLSLWEFRCIWEEAVSPFRHLVPPLSREGPWLASGRARGPCGQRRAPTRVWPFAVNRETRPWFYFLSGAPLIPGQLCRGRMGLPRETRLFARGFRSHLLFSQFSPRARHHGAGSGQRPPCP